MQLRVHLLAKPLNCVHSIAAHTVPCSPTHAHTPLSTYLPATPHPPAQIFPVKLTQEAISVDVSGAQFRGPAGNRGGAGSSIDNNNVFSMQPTVYFDGMDPAQERATPLMTPNAKQVRLSWVC